MYAVVDETAAATGCRGDTLPTPHHRTAPAAGGGGRGAIPRLPRREVALSRAPFVWLAAHVHRIVSSCGVESAKRRAEQDWEDFGPDARADAVVESANTATSDAPEGTWSGACEGILAAPIPPSVVDC